MVRVFNTVVIVAATVHLSDSRVRGLMHDSLKLKLREENDHETEY